MSLPQTMRAWQYTKVSGGLPNSLNLNTSAPLPLPTPDQHLIKIEYCSINPVDYKPAENVMSRRFMIPNLGTPGIDFAGTVVKPAEGSPFNVGQRVFGCGPNPFSGGCLADYAVAGTDSTAAVPKGVSMEDASTIGVAGLTAIQSIKPYVSKGSKVFLNGGSGGTGVYGIQIARALGCEVTTTCSSRNVELCEGLGAEVVDYTKHQDLVGALAGKGFDHIVDNVLTDSKLYFGAHRFSSSKAKFVVVGGALNANTMLNVAKMRTWPGIFGGGKRELLGFFAKGNDADLEEIIGWMAEGKVKPVVDSRFGFKDVPKAFEKLKTGRARGKIVVEVR